MRFVLAIFLVASLSLAAADPGPFGTDFDAAVKAAKKANKPLLVDFFGIWCPPCNDNDELVFSHPEFLAKVKKFVAVKVDADAAASWKPKDKYKIGGYPTILFLRPNGEEIERVVGFRPLRDFLTVMDRASKPGALTLEKACARKEPEHLLRCVQEHAERKEKKAALHAFSALEKKLKPGSFEYVEAASAAADLEENVDQKRQRYLTLLKDHPDFPLAMAWAASYIETFDDRASQKPDAAALRIAADKVTQQIAHPRRGETGLSESDIYQLRAVALSSVQPELSKQLWSEAVLAMERAAKASGRENPGRGFVLEQIGCLERAGRAQEALELAETYRAKFPEEFTFHFKVASMLWRKKDAPNALKAAETAYRKSYGDNKLRVAMLLMELYPANARPGDANRVYEEVTKEIQPSAALDVRTHRYLKQLREAKDRNVPPSGEKKS